MSEYSSLCDDFGASVFLTTKMDLPNQRETVLHFYETLQKSYPRLVDFDRRENGEFALEEERDAGSHRWVTLEPRRLCFGFVNPPELAQFTEYAEHLLEAAPYHLNLAGLDVESLDVMFTFELLYAGNHDEVVAEALGVGTPLDGLLQVPNSRVIHYEPTIMMALEETCRLQARLSIETRTNAYQIRTGQFPEAPIAVNFTVRQYWGKQAYKTFQESFHNQLRLGQELVDGQVVPNVIQPLSRTISAH